MILDTVLFVTNYIKKGLKKRKRIYWFKELGSPEGTINFRHGWVQKLQQRQSQITPLDLSVLLSFQLAYVHRKALPSWWCLAALSYTLASLCFNNYIDKL